MSSVISDGKVNLETSSITSQAAYNQMLNQHATANQKQSANSQANRSAPGVVQGKYPFHSKLHEFADSIEYRSKEKADIANEDDEEVADSSLTQAEIRQLKINIYLISSQNIVAFYLAAISILLLPVFLKENSMMISAFGAIGTIVYFNYWYMYITMSTRQFVLGPTTRRLYRPMIESLESFETFMFLGTVAAISFAFYITHYHLASDIKLLNWMLDRVSKLEGGSYVTEIIILLGGNLVVYMLLKRNLYKKYRALSNKRRMKIDIETTNAAEFSRRIFDGDYDEEQ